MIGTRRSVAGVRRGKPHPPAAPPVSCPPPICRKARHHSGRSQSKWDGAWGGRTASGSRRRSQPSRLCPRDQSIEHTIAAFAVGELADDAAAPAADAGGFCAGSFPSTGGTAAAAEPHTAGYTPPPIREPFSVPWWALLALVPFAVVRWVASGPAADEQGMTAEMAMGFRLGSVMEAVAFACAVAWVAFMIFGRRPQRGYGDNDRNLRPIHARRPRQRYAGKRAFSQHSRCASAGCGAGDDLGGEEPSPVASTNAMPREVFERATVARRRGTGRDNAACAAVGGVRSIRLERHQGGRGPDRRIDLLEAGKGNTRGPSHVRGTAPATARRVARGRRSGSAGALGLAVGD